MRRPALLAAIALLALVPGRAPAAADFRIRTGPHFRLLCHFDDDEVAAAALETVEAVWPLASALHGLPPDPLDPPLDVHLYRRTADYVAASRELVGGKFDSNLAFTSWETRSAHVALQPDLTDEALVAVGLTAQTRHNLAHEAEHLVCGRASASFRSHPDWCSEGAAVWVEEETLVSHGWSAGIDKDPYSSSDAIRARRLLAGGHLPSVAKILRDDIKDLGLYDRYALESLLFRRLVTRNDAPAFRAAYAKALQIEEGEGYGERFLATILDAYRTEGIEGLDLDFEQYVRSRTPEWDEVYRSLGAAGAAWPQIAFADHNAIAWRTAPVGADAYELAGEFEILPGQGKGQQVNVLFARDADDGFLSVAFVAGYGLDVFRYHGREDRWERLAAAPTKAVQTWRRLAFRVSVDGPKVTVRLDGRDLASCEVKDRPLTGAWGLGVQAGDAGVWRGVRLTAK